MTFISAKILAWRGPCGSLSAAINAATQASSIDQPVILGNNALVVKLKAKRLKILDVFGDSSCFFRACSVCLYGHQENHDAMCKTVSSYVREQSKDVSKSEYQDLCKLASNIIKDYSWIGEGTYLTTANYLRRSVHAYIFAVSFSPQIYALMISEISAVTIALAFYEPGHYCSVFDNAGLQSHHYLQVLKRDPVNSTLLVNSPVHDKYRQTLSMSYDTSAIINNNYTAVQSEKGVSFSAIKNFHFEKNKK